MAAEEDDESRMELEQRLRAAVHYTVERVLEEEGEKAGLSFNRQVVAAIAETTFHQCSLFALDLEAFAKHGKRTTVNCDDVKLLARRSKPLNRFVAEGSSALSDERQHRRAQAKGDSSRRRKTKQTGAGAAESEGDSA
ncbi:centromere protein S isoform X1 [Lethenteron reissneri]|uniref:centromere protein S isoform X1 n=1 Tax=Lethenteron reissneri TaxID=7753 RepID=UPI002AB69EC7|nr:centromere protein S isoform X1 [Lethenteron reissneri]